MSVQPGQSSGSQPAESEGRFSTLIGSLAAATSSDRADRAAQDTRAADGIDGGQAPPARATFTARASGPATVVAPEPADTPERGSSGSRVRRAPAPDAAAAAAIDEPLLGDVAALRARWQRVQASFVDGPQEAVGDAADLIEQTAQALVGALRQQQRQLRMMWESRAKPASSDDGPAPSEPDTEHLRLMMQRYRALFNQLCHP